MDYQNLLWPQWRTALPPCVLDGLFDSFSDESLSDADDRNNNDVSELSDRAGGKTDTDSGSIFDEHFCHICLKYRYITCFPLCHTPQNVLYIVFYIIVHSCSMINMSSLH